MRGHHLDGLLLGQRGLVPLGILIQLLQVPGIPFCVVVKGKITQLLNSVICALVLPHLIHGCYICHSICLFVLGS